MCVECDWESAVNDIDDVLYAMNTIDEIPEVAKDSFDCVERKLKRARKWIVENEHVSPGQLEMVSHMSVGVARWMNE